MIVGYLRPTRPVEECQERILALEKENCEPVFVDMDATTDCDASTLDAVLGELSAGDTLVIWSLDDIARSLNELVSIVMALNKDGVRVRAVSDGFDSHNTASVTAVLQCLQEFQERWLMRHWEGRMQNPPRAGRPRILSMEDVERVFTLMREGKSLGEVANELSVSRTTICRYFEEGKRWGFASYGDHLVARPPRTDS